MRAVVQRIARGSVSVSGEELCRAGPGLLALVGVGRDDGAADADWLAEKIVHLRIFERGGKMDASVSDLGGTIILVSQFTLHGDVRKGRRPSFHAAAPPEFAEGLYLQVAERVREHGVRVGTGRFGAHMQVELINDGPVTILLDSRAGAGEQA